MPLCHDPFLMCLLVLLGLLLCGDGPVRVFVSGLWRSVPVVVWRQGGCHMLGLFLAFIALGVVSQAGAAACLVAVALVLLGGGTVFRPVWGVPALIVYGLWPAGLGGLGLMATCLWAAGQAGMSRAGQVATLVLLIGLGHQMAAAHPLLWVSGSLIIAGFCLLAGGGAEWYVLFRYARLVRPVLMLGLLEIARQQAISMGVKTAFCALLLDLTCQVIAAIWPRSAVLSLPVPPLPGFVVGWMGLHTALGLSGGTEGWAVTGCFLAMMVMGLSLGDGVMSFGEIALARPHCKGMEWGGGIVLAAILPSLCGLITQRLLGKASHEAIWFYGLSGGDGSVMALPLFWLALLVMWWCISRGRGVEQGSVSRVEPLMAYMQAVPRPLWSVRRFIVRGQKHMRLLYSSNVASLPSLPLRDFGTVFWLVFLGGVLVTLGVTQ